MFAFTAAAPRAQRRTGRPGGAPAALKPVVSSLLALLLALASAKASAASLGGLTTTVGVFAALATLLAVTGWSSAAAHGLMPVSGALIAVLIGAGLIWRLRRRPAAFVRTTAGGAVALFADAGRPPPVLPAGFDAEQLLRGARGHFVALQSAWDAGDVAALRALTTPDMLDDLCVQLPERGSGPNRTDVLTLQAVVLCFEDLGSAYLMSIEFSGMIRERSDEGAAPFRELWMLAQSKQGAPAWRLARQQALL